MAYIGSLGPAKKVTREEFLQIVEKNNQKIVSVQGEDNAKKITKIKCLRGRIKTPSNLLKRHDGLSLHY